MTSSTPGRGPIRLAVGGAPVTTLDDIAAQLGEWRALAGNPSYSELVNRVGEVRAARGVPAGAQRPGRVTVYECFKSGRQRLDIELVVDIAVALGLDPHDAGEWETACWSVQNGAEAARVVSVRTGLPTLAGHFVGRAEELQAVLEGADGPLFAVTGMAGCGKTQLAAQAARALLDRGDADRVVVADLRGFDAERPPADPDALMKAIVRALDLEPATLPTGAAQRREVIGSLLAEHRTVLILDDAAGAAQVEPLLPVAPQLPVLVTSRVELAADVGAVELALGPLDVDAAAELLVAVATESGVAHDPGDAERLAAAAGNLPLALAIVASRIAARPAWTLADHADALVAQHGSLQIGEALRLAFDLSYASLTPTARRLLRLLAVQPCSGLDQPGVAALAGGDPARARADADELVVASMAMRSPAGDIELHDLIRAHATAASFDEDRQIDRDDAIGQLCDHLVAWTRAAVTALYGTAALPARLARTALDDSACFDVDSATAWLDAQRENLLTLAAPELHRQRPRLAIELSDALGRHFDRRGLHDDGLLLHERAIEVARELGDRCAEGRAELFVGQHLVRLAQRHEAVERLERGMSMLDEDDDAAMLMSARNTLAIVAVVDGDLQGALTRFREAADTARRLGDEARLASVLDNLAITHRRLGELDTALEHHELALAAARSAGDSELTATVLMNVSDLHLLLGDADAALRTATASRAAASQGGFVPTEAYALTNIGCALDRLGRTDEAIEHHQEALELARRIGRLTQEVAIRVNLGLSELSRGALDRALACFQRALDDARAIDERFEVARALDGLGHVAARRDDVDAARRYWGDAVELFDSTGAPEAAAARAALAGLPGPAAASGAS